MSKAMRFISLRQSLQCHWKNYHNYIGTLGMVNPQGLSLCRYTSNSSVPESHKAATCLTINNKNVSKSGILQNDLCQRTLLNYSQGLGLAKGKNMAAVQHFTTREFHVSPKREFHPLVWLIMKPIANLTSILTGRQIRKWWQRMDEEQKVKWRKRLWFYRYKFAIMGLFGATLCVAYVITHIEETPITGRRRFIAFTEKQFLKISEAELEMHTELVKDNIVDTKHPVYDQVVNLAMRIVNANQDVERMRKQKWRVVVVDSAEANAYVLPTGHIFVNTGMLQTCQNLDQLAVVLGHEMAHAILNHGAEQISFVRFLDMFIILTLAVLWLIVPSDGIAIITQWFYKKVIDIMLHLPYSRKLEEEADEVGLRFIAKACFDVRESSAFWQWMKLKKDMNELVETPQFLSTHPNNSSRSVTLDTLVPKAIEMREACSCPKLNSQDPRDTLRQMQELWKEEKLKQQQLLEEEDKNKQVALASKVNPAGA